MQDHEIDAWLGDTQVTPEQRERITAAARAIATRYPEQDDDRDERERAMSGAAQVILGDDTLEQIAGRYVCARATTAEHHAAMTGALIASDDTEVGLAERAGVTRMTVRKALGKR